MLYRYCWCLLFFFSLTGKCRVQSWPQKSSCLLRTRGIGSCIKCDIKLGKQNSAEKNCINFINLKTFDFEKYLKKDI